MPNNILIGNGLYCSRFLEIGAYLQYIFPQNEVFAEHFSCICVAINPTFSTVGVVNNKRYTMSSRKFQGWNSRVPLVEFQSSNIGSREFHCWNSTSRLQIISTQIREGSKKSFPASWGRVNTLLAALRLFGSKNRNKSTAKHIYLEKSTAMYINEIECVMTAYSRFSSFFQILITPARA